jgi:uncharacterized membrane protein
MDPATYKEDGGGEIILAEKLLIYCLLPLNSVRAFLIIIIIIIIIIITIMPKNLSEEIEYNIYY